MFHVSGLRVKIFVNGRSTMRFALGTWESEDGHFVEDECDTYG